MADDVVDTATKEEEGGVLAIDDAVAS